MADDYSAVSLWFDAFGADLRPRPPLSTDAQADVAIVGAGYTGLWTAYYLKTLAPDLSIAIVEAETAGYGASGRNGGWLKGSMAGEDKYLAGLPEPLKHTGYRLLHGIVEHVHGILREEGIECGFHQGGVLFAAARYPEQLDLQRRLLARLYAAGHGEDDYRWLEADELTQQVRMRKPYGAIYSPHCAVIDPARLVRGLADAVERKGVPTAVWAGVPLSDPLAQLQRRVERACRRAGLALERRAYRPHITLARLRRTAAPVGDWLAKHGTLRAGPWQVEGFTLFESQLRPEGPLYSPLVDYEF